MFTIRLAAIQDIDTLCGLDPIAQREARRRSFILSSVEAGLCHVMLVGGEQVVAYGVLEYSFYAHGFVSMLYVHPDDRRRGVGSSLMQHFESLCKTDKIFTSTNLSNLPMQSLLAKLEYTLCGVIHHLDENDPELVYVKYLHGQKS